MSARHDAATASFIADTKAMLEEIDRRIGAYFTRWLHRRFAEFVTELVAIDEAEAGERGADA